VSYLSTIELFCFLNNLGRNYCIISPHDPEGTNAELEQKPIKESTFSKIRKSTFKRSRKDPPANTFPSEGGMDGAGASTMNLDSNKLMRDGLQVTLRVEIDQHDPSGATKAYRFAIPALQGEQATN